MSFEYIDRSIEIVRAIDAEEIEATTIESKNIVGLGSSVEVYGIGEYSIANMPLYLAAKIPLKSGGNRASLRLQQEIQMAAWIADRAPDLLEKLPHFMGQITVSSISIATITEDASRGGEVEVYPMRTSQDSLVLLKEAFKDYGDFYEVFDRTELMRTLAFEVDGKEKFLDFTPSPIRLSPLYLEDEFNWRYFEYCYDRLPDLAVDIDPNSPLARSVNAQL